MATETILDTSADERWMGEALQLARQAAELGEVPVGAVLVHEGEVIGRGFNQPIRTCDATAHAEIVALRDASQFRNNYRLPDTTLYVTLEPCTMCFGAMVHARVGRLVFGANEPKAGAVVSQASLLDAEYFNHRLSTSHGILAEECSALLSDFFKDRRKGN